MSLWMRCSGDSSSCVVELQYEVVVGCSARLAGMGARIQQSIMPGRMCSLVTVRFQWPVAQMETRSRAISMQS